MLPLADIIRERTCMSLGVVPPGNTTRPSGLGMKSIGLLWEKGKVRECGKPGGT